MNCFQISIFAVANTTVLRWTRIYHGLWIAFKLVSLQLQTQQHLEQTWCSCVVNCFQISIFAVANTTQSELVSKECLLWIAFKLVSLQLQTQLVLTMCFRRSVVNCFQISIFAVANTTHTSWRLRWFELWIAFKLVSLQLQTQRAALHLHLLRRCELLSN